MKPKVFCFALCASLFALCSPAQAQQPQKIIRIGYLSNSNPVRDSVRSEGIRRALRELGYIEGQNIAIEYRYAEGKRDRSPELAVELVRLKVDIIVAAGGDGTIRAAQNATKTIPIIMAGSGSDPIEAGLVKSLAHPGGNVTGLTNLVVQLGDKRLELLKEAVPKTIRVAVPYVPGERSHDIELKEVRTAAHALALTIQSWEVRADDDFAKIFGAMRKQPPDGLLVLSGPLMRDNEKRIALLALESRLPSVYTTRAAVDAGGFMYYGADLPASYRRVAYYIDKIVKGAKPADLPIEQPTKFELVLNLKTAKRLGLTIPPSVLARADRVIK